MRVSSTRLEFDFWGTEKRKNLLNLHRSLIQYRLLLNTHNNPLVLFLSITIDLPTL